MTSSNLMAPEIAGMVHAYLQRYTQETAGLANIVAQLNEEAESILLRSNMRGHITSSAVVLDSTQTRILLIHHRALKAWLTPGGHYDAPGNLYESAAREVEEETGVSRVQPLMQATDSSLLDIDTHPIPANPAKAEGDHFHHDFLYLMRAPADAKLQGQEAEVLGVQWEPLADYCQRPGARVARVAQKLRDMGLA